VVSSLLCATTSCCLCTARAQIVRYKDNGRHMVVPRVAWIAAVEAATTTGMLGLQVCWACRHAGHDRRAGHDRHAGHDRRAGPARQACWACRHAGHDRHAGPAGICVCCLNDEGREAHSFSSCMGTCTPRAVLGVSYYVCSPALEA